MLLDLLRQVDDEIERRMKEMITQGEVAREEGLRMLKTAVLRASGANDRKQ